MNNNQNDSCARKINLQFQRLRQHYVKMIRHLDKVVGVVLSQDEVNMWVYGEQNSSPIIVIDTYLYNWDNANREFINRALEREIEENLLANNVGYIEYIENTFANQWGFIKEFKESLSLYINDHEKAIAQYNKLYDTPAKFRIIDFKTAIQVQLIAIFQRAETLYYKYDKKYNRFFKEAEFINKSKTNPDFIPLDYGDSNSDIIKSLFAYFIKFKFIDCSFDEFASHFDPYAAKVPEKLLWSGTTMQLMTLFLGHDLTDPDGKQTYFKLRLKKKVNTAWLTLHFRFPDIKTTNRSLSSNYSSKIENPTIIGAKEILAISDYINSLNI